MIDQQVRSFEPHRERWTIPKSNSGAKPDVTGTIDAPFDGDDDTDRFTIETDGSSC
jgi:hypothetical protein